MTARCLRILITGGAGFIGSALVRHLIVNTPHEMLNLDKLTYAGNERSLDALAGHPRYHFRRADICDGEAVRTIVGEFQPDVVTHLAAETHVDRSIDDPSAFIRTNMMGTATLLQEILPYWRSLDEAARASFRFHHISTDEVFGSLGPEGLFTETSAYDPRSPYSASKAASDHLVRAWHHSYGLPVIVTNCSNNYGPFHHPEKFIPLTIVAALRGRNLPVYGDGLNIRDWLHVGDHVRALTRVFELGRAGETYLVGGRGERTNISVVNSICNALDRISPRNDGRSYRTQIAFVADRPGHDFRYGIDPSKIERELDWRAEEDFDSGLVKTVQWYVDNEWWWAPLEYPY